MECDELVRILSELIDNNLDDDHLRAAVQHLQTCQNCHLVLDSTQRTILLCKDNQNISIPLDLNKKIEDFVWSLVNKPH